MLKQQQMIRNVNIFIYSFNIGIFGKQQKIKSITAHEI